MEKTQGAQDVRLFQVPIHGLVNGNQPVRCIAVGDVPGHSPSYLTVDEAGRSSWQSFENVQIIDTNYLPLSQESFRLLQAAGSGTGTGSGTGSNRASR